MREARKIRFYWAFWRHYAHLWPDNPKAPRFRSGFGRAFVDYYIESADLRIRQGIGGVSVGVYLVGAPGEPIEAVGRRLEPYRQRLEDALPIVPETDRWYGGSMETRNRLKNGTRDWNHWDEMADWFETQRRIYEEILGS